MIKRHTPLSRSRTTRAFDLSPNQPEPIINTRRSRLGRLKSVSLQWYDGAGELHFHTLTRIESMAFPEEK